MKERLVVYGIILLTLYLGMYIWNQKERSAFLTEQLIEYHDTLKKQRELIDAQEEYINYLEIQILPPTHKEIKPYYNQPI